MTAAVTTLTARGPCNKVIDRDTDGTVSKSMARNNGVFLAQTTPAPDLEALADILREVGTHPDCTLSLGVFKGAPTEPFVVLPEAMLARRLGVDPDERDALVGFHEIDGKPTVARLKENMRFGSWLLFDRDCVKGMPRELADLDREAWLAAMNRLVPGLAAARRVLLPSTSSRVVVDDLPMESKSHHLFVQVADPAEIPRVLSQLLPKSFVTTLDPDAPPWEQPVLLGFLRPKYSRADRGEVVAWQPWSIFDPSTASPERLVFDGAPAVRGDGLEVLPPQIECHEGDPLDLSAFEDLDQASIPEIEKRTCTTVRLKRSGKGARARVVGVSTTSATLSLDLEIETERGWTTVGEFIGAAPARRGARALFAKARAGRPATTSFTTARRSSSIPGTNTKYVLPDEREEIRCYGGSLPRNVADAERALGVATCREPALGVYQRGGFLVRIARLPAATAADGIRRAAGSMQILTAGPDFLRLRLTQIAIWLKFDKRSEEWVNTDAPAAVSRSLADTRRAVAAYAQPRWHHRGAGPAPSRNYPRSTGLRSGLGPLLRSGLNGVSRYPGAADQARRGSRARQAARDHRRLSVRRRSIEVRRARPADHATDPLCRARGALDRHQRAQDGQRQDVAVAPARLHRDRPLAGADGTGRRSSGGKEAPPGSPARGLARYRPGQLRAPVEVRRALHCVDRNCHPRPHPGLHPHDQRADHDHLDRHRQCLVDRRRSLEPDPALHPRPALRAPGRTRL